MSEQHRVDRRQTLNAHPRVSQPAQHDQPPGKDGIDQHRLPGNLNQERRMPDERNPKLVALGSVGSWLAPASGVVADWPTSSLR